MANRYWIGGTGTWSDTAHWSTTSGGSGGAAAPTSADDVFFDANSFSSSGQIVTVNATANVKTVDWQNATNNPTWTINTFLNIFGNLFRLKSGMTVNGTLTQIVIKPGSVMTVSVHGDSVDIPHEVYFEPTVNGCTFNLTSEFESSIGIYILSQTNLITFNTNNYNMILRDFGADDSHTINFGTSTVYSSRYFDINWFGGTGNNATLTSSTIVRNSDYSESANYLWTNTNQVLGTVRVTGFLWWSGTNPKVNTVILEPAAFVNLRDSQTYTVNTSYTADGTADNPIILRTDLEGDPATVNRTSGTYTFDWVVLQNITFGGGATWAADTSSNFGTVSGITVTTPTADLLTDVFDSIAFKWNVFGSYSADGQVSLTAPSNSTATGAIQTKHKFNFTGKSIKIKVIDEGDQGVASFITVPLFLYITDAQNAVFFRITGGALKAYKTVSNVTTQLATTTFNETTHRYLRIREASGTTYWEYSPDGITWSTLHSVANPIAVTALQVEISAYKTSSVVGDVTAQYDSLNFDDFLSEFDFVGDALFDTGDYNMVHSASMSFVGGSELTAFIRTEAEPLPRKFTYKVYDIDDNYLGEWKREVLSEFTLPQEINQAGPAIDVVLGRKSDELIPTFDEIADEDADDNVSTETPDPIAGPMTSSNAVGPGTTVNYGNKVEIWVSYGYIDTIDAQDGIPLNLEQGGILESDIGSVNGRLMFTGEIKRYVSNYGGTDNTLVTLYSYGYQLDKDVIQDAGATTVDYFSQDPSTILRSILDDFSGEATYDEISISDTNTVVSYTFKLNTYLEGVQKILELAPYDWYWWYEPAYNKLWFKPRPTNVDHRFVLGQHLVNLDLENHTEDLVNKIYAVGGDTAGSGDPFDTLYKVYEDADSIAAYGIHADRISDERVILEDTLDTMAEALLGRGKDPRNRSTLTISAEVYPIEDINIGELIGFANFGNYIDDLTMLVVGLTYTADHVTLQLDSLLPRVSKRIEDIRRNVKTLEQANIPGTPA